MAVSKRAVLLSTMKKQYDPYAGVDQLQEGTFPPDPAYAPQIGAHPVFDTAPSQYDLAPKPSPAPAPPKIAPQPSFGGGYGAPNPQNVSMAGKFFESGQPSENFNQWKQQEQKQVYDQTYADLTKGKNEPNITYVQPHDRAARRQAIANIRLRDYRTGDVNGMSPTELAQGDIAFAGKNNMAPPSFEDALNKYATPDEMAGFYGSKAEAAMSKAMAEQAPNFTAAQLADMRANTGKTNAGIGLINAQTNSMSQQAQQAKTLFDEDTTLRQSRNTLEAARIAIEQKMVPFTPELQMLTDEAKRLGDSLSQMLQLQAAIVTQGKEPDRQLQYDIMDIKRKLDGNSSRQAQIIQSGSSQAPSATNILNNPMRGYAYGNSAAPSPRQGDYEAQIAIDSNADALNNMDVAMGHWFPRGSDPTLLKQSEDALLLTYSQLSPAGQIAFRNKILSRDSVKSYIQRNPTSKLAQILQYQAPAEPPSVASTAYQYGIR